MSPYLSIHLLDHKFMLSNCTNETKRDLEFRYLYIYKKLIHTQLSYYAHLFENTFHLAYASYNPALSIYPEFPWSEALNVLNTTNLASTIDSHWDKRKENKKKNWISKHEPYSLVLSKNLRTTLVNFLWRCVQVRKATTTTTTNEVEHTHVALIELLAWHSTCTVKVDGKQGRKWRQLVRRRRKTWLQRELLVCKIGLPNNLLYIYKFEYIFKRPVLLIAKNH